ncbi:MAG: hypothetical protein WC208_10460 [Gallionella sp.]|jgi:hypothetical protein
MDTLKFTPAKLKKLKKEYEACNSGTFSFEGHILVKEYAKYLIEYLEGEFKRKGRQV